jgi:hypothetical protein
MNLTKTFLLPDVAGFKQLMRISWRVRVPLVSKGRRDRLKYNLHLFISGKFYLFVFVLSMQGLYYCTSVFRSRVGLSPLQNEFLGPPSPIQMPLSRFVWYSLGLHFQLMHILLFTHHNICLMLLYIVLFWFMNSKEKMPKCCRIVSEGHVEMIYSRRRLLPCFNNL